MNGKRKNLQTLLTELVHDGLCVALSGGVDSALLVKLASTTGGRVEAVTFETGLTPKSDLDWAEKLAQEAGIPHHALSVDVLSLPAVRHNRPDRCYHCKKAVFEVLLGFAQTHGLARAADGTNADDLHIHRPGRKALEELGIVSPFAQCGFTKQEIRTWARELTLPVADRPSSPCLATRLPYGEELTPGRLKVIEQGEDILHGCGFTVCRLRLHGDMGRIEIERAQAERFLLRAGEITEKLKALGLRYVTLDAEFFCSGSMDENLREGETIWM